MRQYAAIQIAALQAVRGKVSVLMLETNNRACVGVAGGSGAGIRCHVHDSEVSCRGRRRQISTISIDTAKIGVRESVAEACASCTSTIIADGGGPTRNCEELVVV